MTPIVMAFDLSLTSTGWAYSDPDWPDGPQLGTITSRTRGAARLLELRDAILELSPEDTDLLLIEDGVVRSSAAKALGELHGVIKVALHQLDITPVLVAPASVKKYATGKGNADKAAMLSAAVQRLGYTGSSFDEVDALWMLAMGLDHAGAPLAAMPAVNRTALDKVEWT